MMKLTHQIMSFKTLNNSTFICCDQKSLWLAVPCSAPWW